MAERLNQAREDKARLEQRMKGIESQGETVVVQVSAGPGQVGGG